MPIPDYQAFMLPLLQAIADGRDHPTREITQRLADQLNLAPAEREEMLPSGQQTVVANRIGWAKTYLKKAGLLENPVRGKVRITLDGRKVLERRPAAIDRRFLEQFPTFQTFIAQDATDSDAISPITQENEDDTKTPEEAIESAYVALRNALADELLDRVKGCSPRFFEVLVIKLLVAMGYGGTLADAGKVLGRARDGGIDGTIDEDTLGLDVLYVQAKRWETNVGRPVVQAFAGSMEGARAMKGVLITTSDFSKDAKDYVSTIGRKIVLIDGKQMAQLMINHNVGVITTRTYSLKRQDSDFFDDNSESGF
jgi:restriction system protein